MHQGAPVRGSSLPLHHSAFLLMSISAAAKSETQACHQVAAQKIASADGLFEAQCPLDNTELYACISFINAYACMCFQ